MTKVLVLYSTVDGQTRRIAEAMAKVLLAEGHDVTLSNARDFPPGGIDAYDGILIGAAIRYSHYNPDFVAFIRRIAPALARKPACFFSVCLSAGGPGARPRTAQRYIDRFVRKTGWRPTQVQSFGGALLYSRYNPFIRLVVRGFVAIAGGDTDTSRDYEYTDWMAVERYARECSRRIEERSRGPLVLEIVDDSIVDLPSSPRGAT